MSKQIEILNKVKSGELSVEDAEIMLSGLNSSKQLPIEAIWNFGREMQRWTLHSSGQYYYKSKDHHQWPPDETASKEELLQKFFVL